MSVAVAGGNKTPGGTTIEDGVRSWLPIEAMP